MYLWYIREILFSYHIVTGTHGLYFCLQQYQTSQLSRFGRETHDFLTDFTTACQSHDLAEILLLLCA